MGEICVQEHREGLHIRDYHRVLHLPLTTAADSLVQGEKSCSQMGVREFPYSLSSAGGPRCTAPAIPQPAQPRAKHPAKNRNKSLFVAPLAASSSHRLLEKEQGSTWKQTVQDYCALLAFSGLLWSAGPRGQHPPSQKSSGTDSQHLS